MGKVRVARLVAAAMIGAVALLPNSASSDDVKYYAGLECQSTALTYASDGSAENGTASSQYFYCPAVRDQTGVNAEINYARVTVNDQHRTANISCTLYIIDLDGDSLYSQTDNSTGAGEQSITYSDTTSQGTAAAIFTFRCTVPGTYAGNKSRVISYRIDEEDT